MSIIFVEEGAQEIRYAIDENDFTWLKVDPPTVCEVECYLCDHVFSEEDGHCWYSVSEAVIYCKGCCIYATIQ